MSGLKITYGIRALFDGDVVEQAGTGQTAVFGGVGAVRNRCYLAHRVVGIAVDQFLRGILH